jgi:hypothetical protein
LFFGSCVNPGGFFAAELLPLCYPHQQRKVLFMKRFKSVCAFILPAVLCFTALHPAGAATTTLTGSLASDSSVFTYNFTSATTQTFNFFTTSYAGGVNANGTTTPRGGFDPVLTLFSSTGTVLGFGGGGGRAACGGAIAADAVTGLCNDANFSRTLGAGNYTLDLTEFPNVALGTLADGFLLGIDPTAISDACGSSTSFLESDVAPCVARTSSFALNVTNPTVTPEPSTLLLVLPGLASLAMLRRRKLS